jgi:hypothetical protein
MDQSPNQHEKADAIAGDLLVGADAIRAYLAYLGMPADVDVYYERRSGRLPIGKYGANLIASKRALTRHTAKLARGSTAA